MIHTPRFRDVGVLVLGASRLALVVSAGATLALLAGLAVVLLRPRGANAVFVVEVASIEQFRIRIDDPSQVRAADDLLRSGDKTTVEGELRPGDGGFNRSRPWHLDPATLRFSKRRRPELDALPSEIDEGLDHWLREIREYAPWSARIVARER